MYFVLMWFSKELIMLRGTGKIFLPANPFFQEIQQMLNKGTNMISTVSRFFPDTAPTHPVKTNTFLSELPTLFGDNDGQRFYRGVESKKALTQILETGFVGAPVAMPSVDLIGYVFDHTEGSNVLNQGPFLSFTRDIRTASKYASYMRVLPVNGFVLETGLTRVTAVPHLLVHLCEDAVLQAQARINENAMREGGRMQNMQVVATCQETTAILGGTKGDNWGPGWQNIISITQIASLGRLTSKFVSSSEPMVVNKIDNPDYKKLAYSMEIICIPGQVTMAHVQQMSQIAADIGLISPGERVLTLTDAEAVINSGELDSYDELDSINKTLEFKSVPKNIAIGDTAALVSYMKQELEETLRPASAARIL